ncbi:MAG: YkvA family protein [Chitinophagales bacterium]
MTVFRRANKWRSTLLSLFYAFRDPRVPWYAKLLGLGAVFYALSPLDLVPDWLPFAGWADDLILTPAALWLAWRLIPPPVVEESRRRGQELVTGVKTRFFAWLGGVLEALLWLVLIVLAIRLFTHWGLLGVR